MIRLNIRQVILLFFLILNNSLFSQNIFDDEHSIKFVKYLFNTKQYRYASIELERLVFKNPNDSLKYLLLKSYRGSLQFDKALERFYQIYLDENSISNLSTHEYIKLLAENKLIDKGLNYINSCNSLTNDDKIIFRIHFNLLNKNWQQANKLFTENPQLRQLSIYQPIIEEAINLKYKSLFVAGTLSTVVPGLGKVYTSYWKDGALAFLSIGTSAWQAYNGFNKDGVQSVYGWIFGSISGILYLSNIYGSAKSAKMYNKNNENSILHKVSHIFRTDF